MTMPHNHDEEKKSVALSSVVASASMTLMKLVVGLMTGSIGIISEAAHSLLDLGAAVLTYFAVRESGKPADAAHHYGHGKVESVSALIETGLLFLTSIFIIFEAGKRLIGGGGEVEATWYAFAVMAISIVIDVYRARALRRVAKKTGSQALEADALHFDSDVWSSSVVIIGLVFVALGMKGADSIAALGVAIFVLHAGWQLGKRTVDVLVDAAPAGVADAATDALRSVPGIVGVERVRVRGIGPTVSLDAVVLVNRTTHGAAIATIIATAERAVRTKFPEADIVLHTKPVSHVAETEADAIRAIVGEIGSQAHDIVIESAGENRRISLDLEVDGTLSIKDAHEIADKAETRVRAAFPDSDVIVHIDPAAVGIAGSKRVSPQEADAIRRVVEGVAETMESVRSVRDVEARSLQGRLALTCRCIFGADMSLEAAHAQADILEAKILASVPSARSVRIHIEPDA